MQLQNRAKVVMKCCSAEVYCLSSASLTEHAVDLYFKL